MHLLINQNKQIILIFYFFTCNKYTQMSSNFVVTWLLWAEPRAELPYKIRYPASYQGSSRVYTLYILYILWAHQSRGRGTIREQSFGNTLNLLSFLQHESLEPQRNAFCSMWETRSLVLISPAPPATAATPAMTDGGVASSCCGRRCKSRGSHGNLRRLASTQPAWQRCVLQSVEASHTYVSEYDQMFPLLHPVSRVVNSYHYFSFLMGSEYAMGQIPQLSGTTMYPTLSCLSSSIKIVIIQPHDYCPWGNIFSIHKTKSELWGNQNFTATIFRFLHNCSLWYNKVFRFISPHN